MSILVCVLGGIAVAALLLSLLSIGLLLQHFKIDHM